MNTSFKKMFRKNRKKKKSKNKNIVRELNFDDINADDYVYESKEIKSDEDKVEILLPHEIKKEVPQKPKEPTPEPKEPTPEPVKPEPKPVKKEIKTRDTNDREIVFNPSKSYTIKCLFPDVSEKKIIDFKLDDNNSKIIFQITQKGNGRITMQYFSKTNGIFKKMSTWSSPRIGSLLMNIRFDSNRIVLTVNKKETIRINHNCNELVDKITWNCDNITVF